MKLPVVNAQGKELRSLEVDDSVFGIEPNHAVLHQAFVTQRNNQRAGTDPGRVIKGVKMAGHMGTGQATVKNLKVVRSDSAKGILMVKGAVPGNEGVLLKVRLTGRRAKK